MKATPRALWRITWGNVRYEAKDGGHRPTRNNHARRVALDAWHARWACEPAAYGPGSGACVPVRPLPLP